MHTNSVEKGTAEVIIPVQDLSVASLHRTACEHPFQISWSLLGCKNGLAEREFPTSGVSLQWNFLCASSGVLICFHILENWQGYKCKEKSWWGSENILFFKIIQLLWNDKWETGDLLIVSVHCDWCHSSFSSGELNLFFVFAIDRSFICVPVCLYCFC